MSNPNDFNIGTIKEFRANGGKVGGYFAGKSLLLLHTTGAKSGEERVNPVACIKDGEHLIIIASKGGAPSHPHWFLNLRANPLVTVETGTETFQARASIPAEPERTRLYAKMVAVNPGFADYEKKTTRVIPVIILERVK